jgi:hypothetical protein
MKKIGLLLLVIVLFFSGCKKDAPIQESFDFGYGFFPLNIGDSSFYLVEQITWNDFDNTIDTVNYSLCEYIESMTVNYTGDSLYRIERLKKYDNAPTWNIDSVWFALKTKNEAIRVEQNSSHVKMVFPVSLNSSWNGNIHNTLGSKTYTFSNLLSNLVVNNISYNRTVNIQQENFVTLINSDVENETYADGVGLVKIEKTHVYKTYNPVSGEFEIKSGYIFSQKRVH